MKKILLLVLAVVLGLSLSFTVFADPGAFQNSPSTLQGPELIDANNDHHDCIARLIITSYADRHTLTDEKRVDLENVYQMLSTTDDISTVVPQLEDLAESLNVKTEDLVASELFDISLTECPYHEFHGSFDVLLKADSLRNFVCLLHYYNGEWVIVEDVEVVLDTYLAFTESDFSPFVIVSIPGGIGNGGIGGIGYGCCRCCCWLILIIVSVIAILTLINLILLISLCKKKKAEEEEEEENEDEENMTEENVTEEAGSEENKPQENK